LKNFSLLVTHVRVQPAMEAIAEDPACRVQGFLAAGHVCTVAGCESYEPFTTRHGLPVVVTGFEPLDLLQGILACVQQLEAGNIAVVNQYARSVQPQGNLAAQQIVDRVYEVRDCPWRGLGVIPAGGLRLREEWAKFDAELRYGRQFADAEESSECRSGEVLTGRIKPPECAHFGTRCNPENPLGAPMVSGEGACAAYYRYRRQPLASPLEGFGA
jgi:hydrogenase expression/formation protein HypD